MLRLPRVLACSVLVTSLLACGTDPEDGSDELLGEADDSDETDGGETDGEPKVPPFQEVYDQGLDDYLGTIEPESVTQDGEQTHYDFAVEDGPMCLRGAPYVISERPGPDTGGDLLLFLQGGGACWSDLCVALETASPGVPESGMLNRGLDGNPFADHNVVFFPYCDGSVFAGDVELDDDQDGELDRFHHGIINLSAGLDVAKSRYPAPPGVVLAGSSAGSYGVHIASMLVRAHWPEAELLIVADAGLGLGRPNEPEFMADLLDEWGTSKYIPQSCPDCADTHITGLVDWQLSQDPDMRYVALSAYQDSIIGGFFLSLNGQLYEETLIQEIGWLADQHPDRYDRFFFNGSLHTTTSADSTTGDGGGIASFFDTRAIDGITVIEWMTMLLDGDPEFDDLLE